MSKRNQRETRSSSSSSSQYQPSPKRLLRDGTPGKDDDHVKLGNIMDKLCHLESRMEDLFGSLKSELSCLRHELNEEIEKVKSTVNDMETSLNAAWDTIKDLQDELKIHAEFRKKHRVKKVWKNTSRTMVFHKALKRKLLCRRVKSTF